MLSLPGTPYFKTRTVAQQCEYKSSPQALKEVSSDFQSIPSLKTSSENLMTTTAAEILEREMSAPIPGCFPLKVVQVFSQVG